jgi:hypothetical protein
MLHSAGIGKLDVNGVTDHSEVTAQTAAVNRYVKFTLCRRRFNNQICRGNAAVMRGLQ